MTRAVSTRLIGGLLLSFAMLLGIAAKGVAAQDATPEAASSFPVTITFINAMTSLDAVDVYINGDDKDQRVVEGLKYGDTSEEFTGTAPGTVVLIKQNVNFGIDYWLFNTLVPTAAGGNYVIVISDFVLIPVQMDLSTTPGDGARTIGVHAAAQAPAVDIYATPSGQDVSLGNVVPVISDLAYGRTTTGAVTAAGSYDLRVTQTGSDTVALEQDGVTIDANMSYVFVIIGKPGSTEQPLTLISVSKATAS